MNVLANDPSDHIIIFSCNSNLDFMYDSQTLYNLLSTYLFTKLMNYLKNVHV